MNAHKHIPAAHTRQSSNDTAPVVSASSTMSPVGLATYSRCPDCDGSFSDRIRDEDTGCFYPVDDGEHYCDSCDAIWTDDALAVSSFEELRLAPGWSRVAL